MSNEQNKNTFSFSRNFGNKLVLIREICVYDKNKKPT